MTRNERFAIRRKDGRSDGQVILDLVKDKEPGTTFSYEELSAALQEGCTKRFTVEDCRQTVYKSRRRLLTEQSRALINVQGYGYKIAAGFEHSLIAKDRKSRADTQLLRGKEVLQNVRWDEMDENQRLAHEGSLMIMSSLVATTQAIQARLDRIEDAISQNVNRGGAS